jgi:lysophospholipase L1-like esterase
MNRIIALVLVALFPASLFAADKTVVACVGDSITHGSGTKDAKTDSYPSQLQTMLGDNFKVVNCGVGGATLLNHGDKPYQKQGLCKTALTSSPNIVVIMLGTNDTKPQNWKYKDQFLADYKNLVDQFKELPTHPKIYLCLPPPVPGKGNYGINQAGVDEEIPMIKEIAKDESAQVIDVFDALKEHPELFPDRVHPNNEGAKVLAKTVDEGIAKEGNAK